MGHRGGIMIDQSKLNTVGEYTQLKPVQSGHPGRRRYVEEIKKFLDEDDGARLTPPIGFTDSCEVTA